MAHFFQFLFTFLKNIRLGSSFNPLLRHVRFLQKNCCISLYALHDLGGVIAGAGGITVGGSVATDAILSRIRKKSAEELIQKYNEKTKEWKEVWLSISMRLQNRAAEQFDLGIDEDMARAFPHWLNFWGDLFHGTGQAGLSVSWSIIYTTIKSSFRLVATLDDAALNGLKIGGGLFRTFGTAGARGLHIAGGVFSILVIPLDIYTMVKSSIDVHKKNPHKTSSAMRKMAETIKEECPTKEKIQSMIQETLNQL